MSDLYRRTKLWDGVGEPPGRESGAKLMWVVPVTIDYEADQPMLGLATTRQLIEELTVRIEMDGMLDYRTVDAALGDSDE